MNQRRGQFYIIAVIIIIVVLIGTFSITNYVRSKNQQSNIYDLGKELNLETGKVLDYGIVNGTNLTSLVQNWSTQYQSYASQQTTDKSNYIFVYGSSDTGDMTAITFTKKDIGIISIGGSDLSLSGNVKTITPIKIPPVGSATNITIYGYTYDFEIKQGQNFFFVISTGNETITSKIKERDGE